MEERPVAHGLITSHAAVDWQAVDDQQGAVVNAVSPHAQRAAPAELNLNHALVESDLAEIEGAIDAKQLRLARTRLARLRELIGAAAQRDQQLLTASRVTGGAP